LPAVAYAWNLLVVIEYAGSGHHDPTALLPLALAFYLAEKRPGLSALAFAAAVLGKLLPLVALPMLWRAWPWRARAVAAAVTGAGLALFAWRALGRSSGLQAYAATWRNNELAFHYAALWMGEPAARLAAAVVIALVALAAARGMKDAAFARAWRRRGPGCTRYLAGARARSVAAFRAGAAQLRCVRSSG
jgi:aryl-alcohol dehydrogenase-like predicted oxidoreductase